MVYGIDGLLPGIIYMPLPDSIVLPPAFLTWQTLLFAFTCYLYGSIPFALIFTRLFKKQDVSRKGTGNIGVANAFGVGGLRPGFSPGGSAQFKMRTICRSP